jgi:transcriptional regulator with XRE-family HTH domain
MSNAFGKHLKRLRMAKGQTLREFCQVNGFDPGNYSRLERGLFLPPQKEELLEKYAAALGLRRGSDEWLEFFDLAAASRGEIPKDLLSDEEVVDKLPVLFRTLRGSAMSPDKLDALVEKIRRS